ncbi:MAG: hypothetical protein MUP85_12500 [Candidatus Lokiarchaeota archaeon]|nr:hypothetical protein [Candidatus Lokiarchaeota archaeon]
MIPPEVKVVIDDKINFLLIGNIKPIKRTLFSGSAFVVVTALSSFVNLLFIIVLL